ncbi:hypothetical protein [Roseococcus sp.]|uniref:hypothetical protein n=1 Tax=Roseococcus sp. TaxID=2109646 RepID=UPI003BA95D15
MQRRALLAGLMAPGLARAALPAGRSRIAFDEPSGAAPGPMTVELYRPAAWRPGGKVVAVQHGLRRDAANYRDAWAPHAEAQGFLLICPHFSAAQFPGARYYNLGNARAPEAEWTFFALDRAVAAALRAVEAPPAPFALYGHSAGAQFVHRYLLLTGAPRVSRLVIANAGWYSWPDFGIAFPYGLGDCAATEAGLRAALTRPVTILLGEADTDPNHPALRRDASSDRQGTTRFERGQAFFAAARMAATRYGVRFGWTLATVPGVGHSDAGMAGPAAEILASAS